MSTLIKRFLSCTEAQDALEYALLAGLLSVGTFAAFQAIDGSIERLYGSLQTAAASAAANHGPLPATAPGHAAAAETVIVPTKVEPHIATAPPRPITTVRGCLSKSASERLSATSNKKDPICPPSIGDRK